MLTVPRVAVEDIKANPITDPFSGTVLQLKELAKTRCRVADLPKILTAMDTARSSYTAFDGFEDEFQFVMSSEHPDSSAAVGALPVNVRKNRYPNVVPCKHTCMHARPRVLLD